MTSPRPTDPDAPDIVPGTITSVVAQVRRPDRVSVHLDGRYAFSLPADVAVTHGLRKGLRLDERQAEALRRARALHEAKQKALSLLSTRPRSEAELRRALARREPDETVIDEVVGRMRELAYLDDAAYAHAYAAARSRSRGYGPRRILAELRRRGVPESLARAAVDELHDSVDPFAAALAAASRVWPRYAKEPDRRRRTGRLYAYLARRGFEGDTILAVVRHLDDPAS